MDAGTNGSGTAGVTFPNQQAYKRGVLKSPPQEFSLTILSPAKHGNAFSYGLRVHPASCDRDSASVRSSSTSSSSNREYEIWRRWEDCLYLQDILEEEYAQMSREKRRRLKSGKGVKKDGVYRTSDFAASFDSLPPGPDWQDIKTDVHEYLPRLNKKGTLFRPSLHLIAQRGKEFEALIRALYLQDNMPTLIRELASLERVRDFFGFWQRDADRLRKSGIDVSLNRSALYSTASSSSISLIPAKSTEHTVNGIYLRVRSPDANLRATATTFDDDAFSLRSIPPSYEAKAHRNGSVSSFASNPRPAPRPKPLASDISPITLSPKTPHSPEVTDDGSITFVLDATDILDEYLLPTPPPSASTTGSFTIDARSSTSNPPKYDCLDSEEECHSPAFRVPCLQPPRWKVESASQRRHTGFAPGSTKKRPPKLELQDENQTTELKIFLPLDSYPDDVNQNLSELAVSPSLSASRTQVHPQLAQGQYHLPHSLRPPWSPTRPLQTPPYNGFFLPPAQPPLPLSPPTSPPRSTMQATRSEFVTVKAIHGNAIIMLKLSRNSTTLTELRERIWEKFAIQEQINISRGFIVAFRKLPNLEGPERRQRTLSTSTISSVSSSGFVEPSQLGFLVLESEWKALVGKCGNKITLVVLDA